MPAIVTLLSDFGSASPYPAAMKAVIAGICDATLIDISHDVPRHNIHIGAYLLASLVRFTPAGTVHLAVIDPGVGTARRPLIVASGGQLFVGPDNGLLLPAAKRAGRPKVFVITPEVLRSEVSSTFHGRDLFAPVAGRLAQGAPVASLSVPIDDYVDLDFGSGSRQGAWLTGSVIFVDPFGNLITNIPSSNLGAVGQAVKVSVGRRTTSGTIVRTYGEASGTLAVIPGSDGLVEVAVREGSAADLLKAATGMRVRIAARRSRR